jgi:hypothetical protein
MEPVSTSKSCPNAAEVALAFLAEAREKKAEEIARLADEKRRADAGFKRRVDRVDAVVAEVRAALEAAGIPLVVVEEGERRFLKVRNNKPRSQNQPVVALGSMFARGNYGLDGEWSGGRLSFGNERFEEDSAAVVWIIEKAVKAYAAWNIL